MNSSPFPVADTAQVSSFAYVPAPMIGVSPVRTLEQRAYRCLLCGGQNKAAKGRIGQDSRVFEDIVVANVASWQMVY